jgi:hypothetical protein
MTKLILNQERFDEALVKHKKILAGLKFSDMTTKEGQEKTSGRFMMLERTGRELALAYSGLKCERNSCGATENLQFHHMIMRQIKDFTDFYRYETQRKYWANILVLCNKCHYEIHTSISQFPGHRPSPNLVIKPELINHVRKKFYKEIEDEKTN